jgi:aryl-alcohol dehydrogenase-like predicted oxidoreductase
MNAREEDMKERTLGKTGFSVSEIGIGTWQVGGTWGTEFDEGLAARILDEAAARGITFIDTADVYSDGRSEEVVGKALKRHPGRFRVATKCGRKVSPHVSAGYTPAVLRGYVEDSLRRLGVETLDLIQLHCPPTEVYYRPEIFGEFDRLKAEGKIRNLGVSVEKVEEGLKAMEYPNVASLQVIFNLFRLRPSGLLFSEAAKKKVGIIVRVPLASGMLSGKFTKDSAFNPRTTGTSTARARPSTRARPSPASTTRRASAPSRSSRPSSPARAWRPRPCAGSSLSTPSRPSFPEPRGRTRSRPMSPPPPCPRRPRPRWRQPAASTRG